MAWQPVVQLHLHSSGAASRLHANAAAALGTPGPAALLLPQILPVLPPHRANHARRGPRFSVVAPCQTGASPLSVQRWTCPTDCSGRAGGPSRRRRIAETGGG